jgi:membrane-bound lytic murein transglycosylase D
MIDVPRRLPALIVAVTVALAACATPAPPSPPPPAIPEPVVTAPSVPEPLPDVALTPAASIADPFPPAVSAQLEPLPPPSDDLWERIRKGYAMPDVEDADVTKWEDYYSGRPDYVQRMVDRSRRYLYHIVVEVEQRGMPLEIALLPMVESAFNPHAMSTSRASGIWQFMPATGTHFGLKQNFWFDSRRDVVAATEGALNYLQKLYAQFNDWQLALAAYNWGEGNVARAIERNQRAGLPTDYASLKMPDETRNYLPKLQALKNIVRDPSRFNLALDDIPDAPYFAVVKTTRRMDVKRAAELAEMPLEEFQYLNPRYNRPVIAGADEYALLLPIDQAALFAAKLALTDQPLVSWQAYRLRTGETLPQVAARFGMEVESLRAVNGIGAHAKVPVGHTLLVPSQQPSHESANTLTEAVFMPVPRAVYTTVPQGRSFYYRVNRGDTLVGIAARYAVSTHDLRQWNKLPQNRIAVGQQLRVTSDSPPDPIKAKHASAGGGKVATAVRGHFKPCCASGKANIKPIAKIKTVTRSAKAPAPRGS